MRAAALAIAAFTLAACGQPSRPETPPEETPGADIVSQDGYGGVRIGMTIEEATAAVGHPLALDPALDDDNACITFRLVESDQEGQPIFMAEEGRVTRVSFYQGATARTPEGVGVGSTGAAVRAAYPNVREQPPPYDAPPAHDLVAWTTPERAGYRFEVGDDGVVRALHAGGPSILYIEGCA